MSKILAPKDGIRSQREWIDTCSSRKLGGMRNTSSMELTVNGSLSATLSVFYLAKILFRLNHWMSNYGHIFGKCNLPVLMGIWCRYKYFPSILNIFSSSGQSDCTVFYSLLFNPSPFVSSSPMHKIKVLSSCCTHLTYFIFLFRMKWYSNG